jgi:hypothetical protein
LDLQKILSELKAERDRIHRAIEALDGMASSSPVKKKRAGVARASGRQSWRNHAGGQETFVRSLEKAMGGAQEKTFLAARKTIGLQLDGLQGMESVVHAPCHRLIPLAA